MTDLIPKHGGYRKLKTFQISQLIYDITVRFCGLYIERFSRTKDQMVQAARSGVQNIAEGSEVSATSKKMELKLTQVARASLEELKLDYEDYLRQRNLIMMEPKHPVLMRFKELRCKNLEEVRNWVEKEHRISMDENGQTLTGDTEKNLITAPGGVCSNQSLSSSCLAANAALSLLNIACYLLDRQVERLARDFENKGGFTERLFKLRSNRKRLE